MIVFTMISSKMDSIYKHPSLNTLNRQLQHSLYEFCLANDPYSSIKQRFHYHPSTHRQPSLANKYKHHKSANKFDEHCANRSKIRLGNKSGRSVPKQSGLFIRTTPIKVRRNPQNRDFTSQFERHQIIQFFDSSRHRTHQNLQKITDFQIKDKQVISDVFCNITAQTAQEITRHEESSYTLQQQLHSENDQSKIKGWSNKTIERLMQEQSNSHLSQHNMNSNWLLPVQFNQMPKQYNTPSYQERQGQTETSQSQKDKQSSIKSLLPMFSIAIVPPSSTSCEEKPTSLILNEEKTAKYQPSIKCVSSSNQLKGQLEVNEQKTSKSNCSLSKTLPKQPSIRRVSNHRLSIPKSYNQSQKTVNKVEIMKQLSENTDLLDSVPFLNTLRSHFDSRNKINIDFTPQKQQQNAVVFLKKSAKKKNMEVPVLTHEKENYKDTVRGSCVEANRVQQNEYLIKEDLHIDLTNLTQL